jgi:hypothetical protein
MNEVALPLEQPEAGAPALAAWARDARRRARLRGRLRSRLLSVVTIRVALAIAA